MAIEACFDPPEYPVTPEIEFENIQFKDVADPGFDSLILTISFKDGDGDLGLRGDELGCYLVGADTICYNDKFTFLNQNGKKVKNFVGVEGTLITYETKRTDPNFSYLPDFLKPYNCINWDVIREEDIVTDTVYFELNPNHYNIFVEFHVKQNDGTFSLFDFQQEFSYPSCGGSFNGRFPILSKDLSREVPLEGTIRYAMQSSAFLLQFSIKTLKLRIRIQDRLLHTSNTIETPEFRLNDIRGN
jgi:hypothetical protein